ncbi:MAG: 16S rRNA (cytosine(1402)-N(4))-methyltransferase RsmH [Deltaproteobacteria bacterium]|nr:16S rRNA (cytosine(1402)-N(4))-methyltransferase RsmH [Deltaproteobacteria bacterium]
MTDGAWHSSVLLENAMRWLRVLPEGTYLDATVGAGGHTEAIARRLSTGIVIGMDRDHTALDIARRRLEPLRDRVRLVHGAFADVNAALADAGVPALDGVLADLGVSSMQFDAPGRGFSFASDAPIDMRMDGDAPLDARTLLKRSSEAEIARILFEYGEERHARRIAREIVTLRESGAELTGRALADAVRRAIPKREWAASRIDPATRTFQAIRIAVNDELGQIEAFLPAAARRCKPGARLVVISFHSLEDRIVKSTFRRWATVETDPITGRPVGEPFARILTKKPEIADEDEVRENPRARSAKLRAVEIVGGRAA